MLVGIVEERVTRGGIRFRSDRVAAERRDAGDALGERFRALVESELDRSYRLAAVILRDAVEAEDAVHDAFESAWRSFTSLREQSSGSAWFQRILVNECRDRLRRRKRRSLLEIVRSPTAAEHPRVPDDPALTGTRDELRREVARLSPEERVVVVLRYVEDLTVPRIAAVLSVPEGTVKSRLHYAVRKLRSALDEGSTK